MTEVSRKNKIKIVARNFFNENPDDFNSYEQALSEFEKVSDAFLETGASPHLIRQEGTLLLMSPGGQVAKLFPHGYFEPVTDMTEEDGEMIRACFQKAVEVLGGKPKALDCLKFIGWVEL